MMRLERIAAQNRANSLDPHLKKYNWPEQYTNRATGKVYQPHHENERDFVFSDTPRNFYVKGGEGSGKSVAGVIKTLERLRRGMSMIMVSPDLEHFKKSLWPEFANWCPWDKVIERHRYRQEVGWEPSRPFNLVFTSELGSYVSLQCGGIKESEVRSWHGPNVSGAYFDEGHRHEEAGALKVLTGRCRIPGPNGEPPQFYITSTTRMNYLYTYFGPIECHCRKCQSDFKIIDTQEYGVIACPTCQSFEYETKDKFLRFKKSAKVITLLTEENIGNLDPDYVDERAASLTEEEKRVYLKAEWVEIETGQWFLPSITLWDNCREELPPITKNEPLILSLDAGISNDSFGIVGITQHPNDQDRLAVRFVQEWIPPANGKLDFLGTFDDPGPERILRWLCEDDSEKGQCYLGQNINYNVALVVYDPSQLHSIMTDIEREDLAWCEEFGQGNPRLEADKNLFDYILQRRLAHSGDTNLRSHLKNANRKVDTLSRKFRLVKRTETAKIDLAVCLSQAVYSYLTYFVGEDVAVARVQ